MPAAMARLFFEKVEPWMGARIIELNSLSKMSLRMPTAPTGTKPPESAFAIRIMSGSAPQCSTAHMRPGAAEARLHLVGDEQRAVLLAEARRLAQVVGPGDVHAVALDRLDDEGRDVARSERALERGQVVEGDSPAAGQHRPEALLEDVVTVQ